MQRVYVKTVARNQTLVKFLDFIIWLINLCAYFLIYIK